MFEIFSLLLGASKRGWPSGKLTFNSFHTGKFPDLRQDSIKFPLFGLVDLNGLVVRCPLVLKLRGKGRVE